MENNIILDSKINKISLIVCWLCVLSGGAIAYSMRSSFFDVFMTWLICGLIVGTLNMIYIINKDNKFLKYVINFAIYVCLLGVTFSQNGAKDNAFGLLCPIAFTGLFFSIRLTVFSLLSGNALIILLYLFFKPQFFPYYNGSEIITICLCLTVIGALIITQAQWGKKIILTSKNKEKESKRLNEKLVTLFSNIANTSLVLDSNIIDLSQNTKVAKDEIVNINQSIHQTNKALENQTANTEDSIKSLYKIEEIIDGVKKNSEDMKISSDSAHAMAQEGEDVVNELVSQIHLIRDAVQLTGNVVSDLSGNSQRINTIVSLIEDVAGQINLLSLNASIEAARAGEQGRGFAVVANEIKNLASQTSNSVRSISEILKEVTEKIGNIHEQVGEGNNAVDKGIKITETSQTYFANISDKINDIKNKVQKVYTDIEFLSGESMKVFKRIEDIGEFGRESTKEMEEIAAVTNNQNEKLDIINELIQSLVEQAQQLKLLTQDL